MADKRAEAKMKGYVGEACPECANFTLVRNGTCLKCDTCGGDDRVLLIIPSVERLIEMRGEVRPN